MGLLSALLSAAILSTVTAAPASRFTLYDLKTPLAGPCDLNTGPDGNIYASTFTADKLVKIDRTSANPKLTEITIPYPRDQLPLSALPSRLQGAGSCVVQPGADGNVYVATGIRNQVAQYNPRNGQFKFFDSAGGVLGNLQPFNDGWPDKTGIWFTQTTANTLSFLNYSTGKMTVYPVPTQASSPVGVIVVPSGDVWICEFLGQKIAKFDPNTNKFTEYPVPPSLLGPAVVRAFTGGKYIWFTAITANAIGRVDITTGAMKAYPNTLNLGVPIEDTSDGKGNVCKLCDTTQYFAMVTHISQGSRRQRPTRSTTSTLAQANSHQSHNQMVASQPPLCLYHHLPISQCTGSRKTIRCGSRSSQAIALVAISSKEINDHQCNRLQYSFCSSSWFTI